MASLKGGIPTSLIRQVQISLREEAGVPSSYDRALLLDLDNHHHSSSSSSISEVIERFDPSIPSYLRCKQCRGGLLRGVQSIVCVYCGAQQRKQIPPDPIPFKSTFSYAWLLQSLELDGSEAIIALATGDHDSTKGQNISKNESVLSDLFDLELKWSAELKEVECVIDNKAPFQSKSSLNLAGVDLDNFFIEPTKEATSVPKEPLMPPNKESKSIETRKFPGQESISLFDSAQSSNVAVRTSKTEDGVDDTLSGWEAEFQSASSGTLPGNSKLHDLFMVPPIDLPTHVDSVFGPDTGLKINNSVDSDVKTKNDLFPLASIGESKENSNNSTYTNDSWIRDDLWPSGETRESKNEKVNTNDGSIDTWQDFPSSGNSMREMEFGSFMQPDLFPGVSRSDNSSADVNNMQETSISSRAEVVGLKTEDDGKSRTNGDESSNTSMQKDPVKSTEVESLMSQMHDLSFMLDSNLSIPKRSRSDTVGSDL